jgi:hypothetical protein
VIWIRTKANGVLLLEFSTTLFDREHALDGRLMEQEYGSSDAMPLARLADLLPIDPAIQKPPFGGQARQVTVASWIQSAVRKPTIKFSAPEGGS